jgi:hypothetical protein
MFDGGGHDGETTFDGVVVRLAIFSVVSSLVVLVGIWSLL